MKKDLNALLKEFRDITPHMTQERYEYLKNNYRMPVLDALHVKKLERLGAGQELIARAEFAYLFRAYEGKYYRIWKKLDWGMKENESLQSFALGGLINEIEEYNKIPKGGKNI